MTIEWLRDLIIVIFGIAATLAVVIMLILAFMLYGRVKPVLRSAEKTAKTVERITNSVEEAVAGPLAQVISFVRGIAKAVGMVRDFTDREGKRNER